MKSFIGWIGGKSHLKKYIIPLIPNDCERYIEVFGGSGAVLFGKEKVKNQIEVFNDIDSNLINLYRQVRNNLSALQAEIDWLQSREIFNDYRKDIEENAVLSDVQRAARYLYLIKCSFGCNKNSFGTARKSIFNIIDELPKYQERLKSVIIENRDFEQLIKTYDRPNALFFADPPYIASERYYKHQSHTFNTSDHNRLKTVLNSIKGRFILTYNDCDLVREMYKSYKITPICRKNLLAAGTNNKEFKEVIITNY